MRIMITGGTGFIGQALCPRLAAAGHEVVLLSRQAKPRLPGGASSSVTRLDDLDAGGFGGVINLAGEPIGEGRWTPARRKPPRSRTWRRSHPDRTGPGRSSC